MKSLGTLIVVCISLVVVRGAHAHNLDGISDISPTSLAKSHGATITSPTEAQRPAVNADIIRMAQTKLQPQPQPQKIAPSGPSQIIEGVTVRRNKATAQEGYELKKSGSRFTVYRMGTNLVGGTFVCYCPSDKGKCNLIQGDGQNLSCVNTKKGGCTEKCKLGTIITGDTGLFAQ
jgi:hypothetical protein